MTRFCRIAEAAYQVVRLRMTNPRMSRCMLVSILLALALTGPIARAHTALSTSDHFPRFVMVHEIAKQVFDTGGSKPAAK